LCAILTTHRATGGPMRCGISERRALMETEQIVSRRIVWRSFKVLDPTSRSVAATIGASYRSNLHMDRPFGADVSGRLRKPVGVGSTKQSSAPSAAPMSNPSRRRQVAAYFPPRQHFRDPRQGALFRAASRLGRLSWVERPAGGGSTAAPLLARRAASAFCSRNARVTGAG
jgi:hypothetical protein